MQPISTGNLINYAVVRCKYDVGMILSNLILKHVYQLQSPTACHFCHDHNKVSWHRDDPLKNFNT